MIKATEYTWLPKGTVLHGAFSIKRKMAVSDLSVVYLGLCQKTGEKCVIKEHFPQKLALRDLDKVSVLWRSPGLKASYFKSQAQFLNEAAILKNTCSDHIVQYIDHFIQNNTGYIVLKYYPGITLDEYIKEEKNVSIIGFFKKTYLPLLKAVDQMHKKGIIHRDLKPTNILINKKGKPVVIDFGSAVNYQQNNDKNIFVTPGFSPLEFYSETSKQGRFSDVYSLVATLYYYLCGRSPADVSQRIIEDKIEDIRKFNQIISPGFSKVIMANLALDYRKRYSSLGKLRRSVQMESLRLKLMGYR